MILTHRIPNSQFALAAGERDGLPTVAAINVAYGNGIACCECPWLLSITIDLEEQNDVGLPTDEEAELLNAAEDAIEAELADATPFHTIARQSWNGQRVIDYYVQHGAKALQCVESLAANGAIARPMHATIERDPQWSSWLPTLQSFAHSQAAW